MAETDYRGIDYAGITRVNRDIGTGIRYGIISSHVLGEFWYEGFESEYAGPNCPECGGEVKSHNRNVTHKADCPSGADFRCPACKRCWESGDCYSEEPVSFDYASDGYILHQTPEDSDIWVFKSPYYTYAQFCSPCAPGACHLEHPLTDPDPARDVRCYALGHDWFDGGAAPYPLYSVKTGKLVTPDGAA